MINNKIDSFEYVDNFKKITTVFSIPIICSRLKYIPQVTIAIPTYKRSGLLKVALDSALNQENYDCFDVIVVDNNPERKDDTERLLMTYNDCRLSYFKNTSNVGMAGNWNKLFVLSKSKWVVMLHDDDVLLPNFLQESMSILEKHSDIGILKPSSFKWWSNQNSNIPFVNQNNRYFRLQRLYDVSNYFGYVLGPPSGCLFSREKVLTLGGFDQSYYPSIDYYFVVLFSKYYKVYKCNKTLSIYRYSVNESLKEEVLDAFIIQDCFLIDRILTEYYVPKFIKKIIIGFRVKYWVEKFCKKLNPQFLYRGNVDYHISPFIGNLSRFFVYIYLFSIRMFKSKLCVL